MKKVAVMVLLSLVFVSALQSISFAIVDDGRATERRIEHTMKAASKYAQGDKEGAAAEIAKDIVEAGTMMAAGAATGAAMGSFVPIVGTAVGAGIGAVLGGIAGWILGPAD